MARNNRGKDAGPRPGPPIEYLTSAQPNRRLGSYERLCTHVLVSEKWHQKALLLPNGLCVVMLADTHPLVTSAANVCEASLKLQVSISGKRKRGAALVAQETSVCIAIDTEGKKHKLRCLVRGNLIETNSNLEKNPQLLKDEHDKGGYLCIIEPENLQKCVKEPLEKLPDVEHVEEDS